MSKQSVAKEEQGYSKASPKCGNCRRLLSDMVPVPWMVENNKERESCGLLPFYDLTLAQHNLEKNLRCGIGGFAVKKMGHCKRWEGESE